MNIFRHILTPWFRSIRSDLRTFLINLIGMSVAVFSLIIISMWVYSEVSFDKFNSNYKNIYLITWKQSHMSVVRPATSDFEGPTMKSQFPEVLNYVRIQNVSEVLFQRNTNEILTYNGVGADSTVFSIFSLDLVRGDKNRALRSPEDILISESLAQKYFGKSDPMSKPIMTIKINKRIYAVAGVFRDLPANSTLQFDFLVPNDRYSQDWNRDLETSFVLINNIRAIEPLKKKMIYTCRQAYSSESEVSLFPLQDIHFHSNFNLFGRIQYGNLNYIKIFLAVAFFILMIAGFNVINLTTAKIEKRSRDIGLRKILGAGSSTLYKQFLIESFGFSIIVVVVAFVLAAIIMPALAGLKPDLSFIVYFIPGIILFIWLLTGFYPATFFSGINPFYAMKGRGYKSKSNVSLRKFLVSFQFLLSIFLLTASFWVIGQISYLRNADLGFNPKNIVMIPSFYHFSEVDKEFQAMNDLQRSEFFQTMMKTGTYAESELKRNPIINGYTYGEGFEKQWEDQIWVNGRGSDESMMMHEVLLGQDFDQVLNIKILSGRSFTNTMQFDECVINETAVKYLDLKEPVGTTIRNSSGYSVRIVGVIINFHFEHISKPIGPLVIFKGSNDSPMCIKVSKNHLQEGIKFIRQLYDYKRSDIPFTYKLLENEINKKYENDYHAYWIIIFFSILALIISCMGIYGLAGFQAESRTREIAVRKVFGAQVRDMHTLFLLEFGKYVFIGLALGWPLAYYVLREYASNFALHPAITFWPFLLSGLILGLITFVTVESQIRIVCAKNAAETLKYE
jgi:putative ABC transport system permease protein